jgi:two-component system, NtrC family, response regulator
MANILIIDDDSSICKMLEKMAGRMGHGAKASYTLQSGIEMNAAAYFDIVFLDVAMPDGNGIEAIQTIKETPSNPEIIIITGMGDQNGAELAVTYGAWDYIEKSSSINDLRLSLERALQYRRQKECSRSLALLKRDRIAGNSPKLTSCLERLALAAQSEANVLLTGETGTGKELFAQALHQNSRRSQKNFVVVDCAAMPDTLIENLMFGHAKGAFTGANCINQGLLEQADGGTLFLDEIGELPHAVQKVFLRVVQERRFRPLGAKHEIKSNFRLVAATNRDLAQMVQHGEFRQDLLYRIQSMTIQLPPLRERREDIRDIVKYHIAKIQAQSGMPKKEISDSFFQCVENYSWPGNVRELIQSIEVAFTRAQNHPVLFSQHLPTHIRARAARKKVHLKEPRNCAITATLPDQSPLPALHDFINAMRAQYLQQLMAWADNNVKKACAAAGISRARLYQLLNQHQKAASE